MTYSLESAFVRAYSTAAVAVQAVLDATAKLEKLTRPVRRGGFDEDAAGEFLAVSRTYSADEANAAIERQMVRDGLIKDRGTGAINDGEPQQVTLSGREFERYLDGALNEPYIDEDDETNRCYFCGDPTENLVNADDDPEFVCEDCCDDTPNPTEPGLDDAELIGVRGMLQERYGDQSERADTQDAQMWRAVVSGDVPRPYCNARQFDGPSYLCTEPCGHSGEHKATVLGEECASWPQDFAGAAASLADSTNPRPSVREDKQRDEVSSLASAKSPADPHTDAPVASATGSSPAGVDSAPLRPPAGRTDPSPTINQSAPPPSVVGEGPAGSTHSPESPAGRSDQHIHDVLIEHSRIAVSADGVRWGCRCDRTTALGPGGYVDHVLDVLNALAPQPKPAFPETGLDMGARLDGASEFYPQHRKTK